MAGRMSQAMTATGPCTSTMTPIGVVPGTAVDVLVNMSKLYIEVAGILFLVRKGWERFS